MGTPSIVFLCLVVGIAAAGYVGYLRQAASLRPAAASREFAAIRDLKAGEIARWFAGERRSAQTVSRGPVLYRQVRAWTATGARPPAPAVVRDELGTVRFSEDYGRVLLLGKGSRVLLSEPHAGPPPGAYTRALAAEALARGEVVFSELYSDAGGNLVAEFLAPLRGDRSSSSIPPVVGP